MAFSRCRIVEFSGDNIGPATEASAVNRAGGGFPGLSGLSSKMCKFFPSCSTARPVCYVSSQSPYADLRIKLKKDALTFLSFASFFNRLQQYFFKFLQCRFCSRSAFAQISETVIYLTLQTGRHPSLRLSE